MTSGHLYMVDKIAASYPDGESCPQQLEVISEAAEMNMHRDQIGLLSLDAFSLELWERAEALVPPLT